MQIILTKLAVTVFRLSHLKISTVKEFLISIVIMLQTFDAKCLNEFKPIFVILNYSLILW